MTRTPVRVLLVEDDQVDRLACRRALANHPDYSFELIEAETGHEGIRQALARQPDLILLDYHLPDLSGLEFLAELQREGDEMPVPVMMLTGADNVGVAVEAMRRGARDYLVKDRDRNYLELLPAVIERVLREQRLRGEKRAAEVKFRTLVEQIPAITYMAALDVPGRLLYISPQVQSLGFSPEEWLTAAEGLLKAVHPDDRAVVRSAYADSYASGEPLRCEYRVETRAGETRWLLDEARIVRDAFDVPLFLQGVLIDITEDKRREEELHHHRQHLEEMVAERTTQLERQADLLKSTNANLLNEIDERRHAEQALRASEARFRLLLESAGEGIYGLDTEGRCIFVNDAALEMTGFVRDELLGQTTHPHIHHSLSDGTPYPAEKCPIYEAFRAGVAQRGMTEPLWRKDGSMMIAEYSSYPLREGDEVSGAVLVFRDVTESQALADQLAWQATHDALTGLVNRREFERRLTQVLGSAHREGAAHALCYLDLDQFKVVNDTCGHAAGDELLRQISTLLQGRMRQRDTLARLGGDEFGILLEHCPTDRAMRLALELRDAVRDFRFNWQGRSFTLGVSIGIAPLTGSTDTAAAAMRAADAACYIAKEQGRNRAHLYHADDINLVEHRSQMLWVLRLTQALDEDRFRLYYQTIVPLNSGPSTRPHYEVLLRLLEPDGRLVEPMAFVPAAERHNLMPAIDRWVLREVIRNSAAAQRTAEPRPLFAVNLSSRSLTDEHLPDYLRELLANHGVPGDMLCLEITEAAAAANLNQANLMIAAFKQLGCRIALDHFGCGMSSFTDLKALPVDFVKIDGGFIRSLAVDRVNRAVADAINRIAHVMMIQTVAECTETDAVVTILKELGIDHAQGYVLARPQPIERLSETAPLA
jgi:diguanylate cyclase (GGDEF)-like protein/PAS domain S-box-containing protein